MLADQVNIFKLGAPLVQKVYIPLLKMQIPTICVMNGHALAGGCIFALCHDVRIMQQQATVCLSEINIGLPLPRAYTEIVRAFAPAHLLNKLYFGEKIKSDEALAEKVADHLYTDRSQAWQLVAAFRR